MEGNIVFNCIGQGCGESIVIEFADKTIGVIDFYALSNNKITHHPTINFVKKLNPTSIRFVILTHPHCDHIFGAKAFLEEFEEIIEKLILPDFFVEPRLWELVGLLISNTTILELRENFKYLQNEIYGIIEWLERNIGKCKRVNQTTQDLPLSNGATLRFYGPLQEVGNEKAILTQYNIFEEGGEKAQKIWEKEINSLSVMMGIEFGKAKLMLTGDSAKDCEGVLKRLKSSCPRKTNDDFFQIIKIPHHGSINACNFCFCDTGSKNKPIGILTPFKNSGLPNKTRILDILNSYKFVAATARLPEDYQWFKPKKMLKSDDSDDIIESSEFAEMLEKKESDISFVKDKLENFDGLEPILENGIENEHRVRITLSNEGKVLYSRGGLQTGFSVETSEVDRLLRKS